MTETSTCVICNGGIRRLRRALVAPFLAERIWGRRPFCVDLVQCRACGFQFYNPRLEAADEARLYGGYRSEEYLRMRHASEPWYTARLNASLASPVFYDFRRRKVASILRQHIGSRPIRRILDYGGDGGCLVRGLFEGAESYVYDISGAPAVEGVTATSDPAATKADLIINSNVLEHVGFPRRLVEEVRAAAPAGGLIFLEVPCESPLGLSRIARRFAQAGLTALARPALARSVACRASLYMMHEHINYYTDSSLSALMRSCGCPVIAGGRYYLQTPAGNGDMAWCLGIAA